MNIDQSVAAAIAEKIAAMRTDEFFATRKGKGDRGAFLRLMTHTGGEPPQLGDELP